MKALKSLFESFAVVLFLLFLVTSVYQILYPHWEFLHEDWLVHCDVMRGAPRMVPVANTCLSDQSEVQRLIADREKGGMTCTVKRVRVRHCKSL